MRVVDINKDFGKTCNGVYWIDTNVLLWYFYHPIIELSSSKKYQLEKYPPFISSLINNNCLVATSIYNISEMIPCIERNEFEIYCKKKGLDIDKNYKKRLKIFRNEISNRKRLKYIIENIMLQIKELVVIETCDCCLENINTYVDSYIDYKLDFFDFMLAKNIECNRDTHLVTDDKDFFNDRLNFVTYTANNHFITMAKEAGISVS